MDLRSRSTVSIASLQGDGATGQAAVDAADVNSAEHIRDSRHTILDRWQALQEVAKTRRTRLDDSRKLQVRTCKEPFKAIFCQTAVVVAAAAPAEHR